MGWQVRPGGRRVVALQDTHDKVETLCGNIAKVIVGKDDVIRLVVVGLLARGHMLIEDIPGIGKTTLANALAKSINCSFQRIQFTSDLLPSDIIGISIYNPKENKFEFQRGPIFANVVLADEINRTTPKTQSCLLEAMNDQQVSVDSTTYPLPHPFIVIATQNPVEHYGTFPLPESQLDRFMLKIDIGYPSPEEEEKLLETRKGRDPLDAIGPVITIEDVLEMQGAVDDVRMDSSLTSYVMDIVTATRKSSLIEVGVSPRGSLAGYRLAQAHALVQGRDYVIPDDVKSLAVPAFAHRIVLSSDYGQRAAQSTTASQVIRDIIESIPVPL
jgi:MoxR-like ATPase